MTAFDAARRSSAAELMDDETVDFETFRACLADLAVVNRLTLAYRPTIDFLERLRQASRLASSRPLKIVDVGSGYGDMLREIARWGAERNVPLRLTGVDRNPWAARSAAAATPAGMAVDWLTADVFEVAPDADLVVSSLFAHHLDDAALARFLAWSETHARTGWFVNDLHRHPLSFHGFRLAARALGRHRFVQHDGPVSIARSFRPADWRRAFAGAGIAADAVEIRRRFPFRLCVARVKP